MGGPNHFLVLAKIQCVSTIGVCTIKVVNDRQSSPFDITSHNTSNF
jgi:hypothetical protein